MSIHLACGDQQEGSGWVSVMETGAAEDEEGHSGGRAMFSFTCGSSLLVSVQCSSVWLSPWCLVPVPQVTSSSQCQVTFGVGCQLPGFSGMAKCGFLATKGGFFLLLDQICCLTASMLNAAPTWAAPGHGCTRDITLTGSWSDAATGAWSRLNIAEETAPLF